MKKLTASITFLCLLCLQPVFSAQVQEANTAVKSVKALNVVKSPKAYMNQKIKMRVVFDKFSVLGLDYPKVNRSSEKYIGFMIQRDDVLDHDVPLSEMKLFLKRDYAEKFAELDTGDKLEITGTVFSTALGDP